MQEIQAGKDFVNDVNHSTQVIEWGTNGAGGFKSVFVRMMHGYKTS